MAVNRVEKQVRNIDQGDWGNAEREKNGRFTRISPTAKLFWEDVRVTSMHGVGR